MIVISPDCGGGMSLDPIDTGDGINPIFHQISQKKTGIERLANRTQRKRICMNISENKNFHRHFNQVNPQPESRIRLDG
jgi:hypothetical protein